MTNGLHTACCKLLLSIVPDPPLQAADERGWLTMCTSGTLRLSGFKILPSGILFVLHTTILLNTFYLSLIKEKLL